MSIATIIASSSGLGTSPGWYPLGYSSTITPNWDDGSIQYVILTGNPTIADIINPPSTAFQGFFILVLVQDGTGNRTVTWGAGYGIGSPPNLPPNPITTPGVATTYFFVQTNITGVWYLLFWSANH